jgi:regulator of RNase E activity RraA
MRTTCINTEPVQLGRGPQATSVGPGDLVIGDADCIVVVPVAWADEVLARAEERHAIDTGAQADPNRERFRALYGLVFDDIPTRV